MIDKPKLISLTHKLQNQIYPPQTVEGHWKRLKLPSIKTQALILEPFSLLVQNDLGYISPWWPEAISLYCCLRTTLVIVARKKKWNRIAFLARSEITFPCGVFLSSNPDFPQSFSPHLSRGLNYAVWLVVKWHGGFDAYFRCLWTSALIICILEIYRFPPVVLLVVYLF